ncbi:MAG: HEAT repeat domain-containing protein [Verrucomicrobiota bacterium]
MNRTVVLGMLALACPLWVFGATTTDDRAKTRELVAVLGSGASEYERARACQQLAIIGTPEAVPVLAALLGDAKLGHYAREALEAMASPAADAALREALGRVQGDHLIGVVNSLGFRRDMVAVPALQKLAIDPASPAAGAALLALARAGTDAAADTVRKVFLEGPPALRAKAAEAYLVVAEQLVPKRASMAARAYDEIRNAATLPEQVKLSALRGAILTRGEAGVPLVLESIRSSDEEVRGVGLRAVRELKGLGVQAAILAELGRLPASVQALTIPALVGRGEEGIRLPIEELTVSPDASVRLVAWQALGKIGGASSVPLLVKALSSGATPAELEAVQRSLAEISAPEADKAMLAALATSAPAVQVKLMMILGERGAEQATPEVLRLASDPDRTIRGGALRSLALLAKPADIPALIQLSLKGVDDEARTLADRAIHGAAMKILEPERRAEPLVVAYRGAKSPAEKAALLRPLGAIVRAMGGSEAARVAVTAALRESDGAVREAAVKVLADWPDASAVPALLEFLKTNPPEAQRATTLDGVVRLAANVAAGTDKTSLDVVAAFTQANAAVKTDGDRMKIVSGLGNVRKVEALRMLQPYLDIPAVKTEAALAVVQIAPALLGGAQAASVKAILERIAKEEKDADVKAKAERLLKGGAPQAAKKGKKK